MKWFKYISAIVVAAVLSASILCFARKADKPSQAAGTEVQQEELSQAETLETVESQEVGAVEAEAVKVVESQEAAEEEGGINTSELILSHVKDSYEWHFWGSGEKTVAIYLPVIVHSKTTGWHCFSSRRIAEGETYEGFHIAPSGAKHEGKLVEITPTGEEVKPFDISITKNVLGLMINSCVLLLILMLCTRWYKRHDVLQEAPRGIAALIEPVIIFIDDEVIKDAVGPEHEKFAPYLLTVFFFILTNNLMGIIPFFPGGANVTGNIAITFTLAVCTFIAVNFFAGTHQAKEIFWPEVPWWLKLPIPIMPVIEIISSLTKPFALMIRLFVNILAGHCMVLSIICVVFLTAKMGPVINGSLSFVAVLFGIFVDLIEILVAFIQAYVFTMLSAVFIGMAHPHDENWQKAAKRVEK